MSNSTANEMQDPENTSSARQSSEPLSGAPSNDGPLEFLRDLIPKVPTELKPYLVEFQTLYDRSLWHPLTVQLLKFYHLPAANPHLLDIYEGFIKPWQGKMNPLALVKLASCVSKTLTPEKAPEFLLQVSEKVQSEPPAYSLALTEAAFYQLQNGDLTAAKAAVKTSKELLDGLAGLDFAVHASQYRVAAAVDQASLNYSSYYKNALLFLGIMPPNELALEEKYQWAYRLSISALLGDDVYNFSELLNGPSLSVLDGSPAEWIHRLLIAFNDGDNQTVENLISQHSSEDFISLNALFLRQKQCLMALVEGIFKKYYNEKIMSFDEISAWTNLPLSDVEYLIMKAMGLDLIRGSIDEIEKKVNVTWVQPRVLNKQQMKSYSDKIFEWQEKVKNIARFAMNETEDWLVPI